jgi:hypothetical protein
VFALIVAFALALCYPVYRNIEGGNMAFWEQVEVFVNESVKFSKQAYDKARELGAVARLELDVRSLQGKAHKAFAALGGLVYEKLSDGQQESIAASDAAIAEFVQEIQKIEQQIKQKEQEIRDIKAAGGRDAAE